VAKHHIVAIHLQAFLSSLLYLGDIVLRLQPLYRQERVPDTHWMRGWVVLRAGLDAVQKRAFVSV